MYLADQTIISPGDELYAYLDRNAHLAKCLYNASLFRIRQIFTGWGKESRTGNEAGVFAEVARLETAYPSFHVRRRVSYKHLEKLMRVTGNPDFFAGLPMQTAQQVLKQAIQDFKGWLAAVKDYKKHPDKYLGAPKMPGYKKSDICTYTITNQDAALHPAKGGGMECKLPLTKMRLCLPHAQEGAVLKEAKVKALLRQVHPVTHHRNSRHPGSINREGNGSH